MFEKCSNCQSRVLSGHRNEQGVFCSRECQSFFAYPAFCPACAEATTDTSSGSTYTLNGIGTKLYGRAEPCSICGSVRQTLWFCFIFVPLIPLGKYRVKYMSPGRFASRKIVQRG